MILNLKEIFWEQVRPYRYDILGTRALINTKVTEKTQMKEHILKIFDHLNTLDNLGGEIDAESQIDNILE